MSKFPKLLYRRGTMENCWGVMCDTRRVEDAETLDVLLGEGWSLHVPGFEPAPAETPLAKAFRLEAELQAHIDSLTEDDRKAFLHDGDAEPVASVSELVPEKRKPGRPPKASNVD